MAVDIARVFWHSSGHIPPGHEIHNSNRVFRHVAVPLIAGRRMSPEEKVIPKTDCDLPIVTCSSTIWSWRGSVVLSSCNTALGNLSYPNRGSKHRLQNSTRKLLFFRTDNQCTYPRFCGTKVQRLNTGFTFHCVSLEGKTLTSSCSGTALERESYRYSGPIVLFSQRVLQCKDWLCP